MDRSSTTPTGRDTFRPGQVPADRGAGEALLLSGDPGVGKTSLLERAAALAAGSGIRLLRAAGSQFEVDSSFAALHQLLHPCFAELPHLTPLHAQPLNVALGLGEGPPPAQLLVASAVLACYSRPPRSNHCCSSSTTCRGWTGPAHSCSAWRRVAWPAFRWPCSPRAGPVSPASSTRATCPSCG